MKRALDFFWPVLGMVAVLVAFWLLAREFRGEAVRRDVIEALRAIPPHRSKPR